MSKPIVEERDAPLILSMPHVGREVPDHVASQLTGKALELGDTDWWIDRLYDFGEELGATVIRATASRYVIDVNRDPSGASLYPGQATTGLCPASDFDGVSLYRNGQGPTEEEIDRHRRPWHTAYHEALAAEIARLEESRLAAIELRVQADLEAGRHEELASELQQLTREHPWRERLHAQLMLALYRNGRQAEALDQLQQDTGLDVDIHVDGASGAFLAPFCAPDIEWDFRVPRVKSISTSSLSSDSTCVPSGTRMTRSLPPAPVRFEPDPPEPRGARKCCV